MSVEASRSVSVLASLCALAATAAAGTLHVPGDAASIQDAISLASSGDTILVAAGTWNENIDLSGKQLELVGMDGAAATSIAAAVAGSVVTARNGEPAGTLLRGFTITGGTGQWGPDAFGGGGVYVGQGAQLELRECVISGNSVAGSVLYYGGGVFTNGTVTLVDCVLSGNSAPRGAALGGTSGQTVNMSGCTITGNTSPASEWALHISGGSGTIEGCLIADNTGGGLWRTGYSLVVKDCTFRGNSGWGYRHFGHVGPEVADCRFLGNGLGGALLLEGSVIDYAGVATRCVFAGGDVLQIHGSGPGGGSFVESCTFDGGSYVVANDEPVTLHNSIVRGAVTPVVGGTSVSVTWCDIEGGYPGEGNIDADPLWVDAAAGDYALQPGSPCINAGDIASPGDPDESSIDMGAVAYHPWTDLGGGVAGTAGLPVLSGHGPLEPGVYMFVQLDGAKPLTATTLFVGTSSLGAPFRGGIFWPTPDLVVPGLVTNTGGTAALAAVWPAGLPVGIAFWAQCWFADAGAPHGAAGSNGLCGVPP